MCLYGSQTRLQTGLFLSSEYYLSVYEALHKDLYRSNVIHADETPCRVVRDGRDTNSKRYMWVYHSGTHASKHPIVIYDYQQTRHYYHPKEFLNDYSGVLVADGYQALAKKRDALSKKDFEKQRLIVVKPLVDDFFLWVKEQLLPVPADGTTFKGLMYCINQEQFLHVFLKDGNVPMDNNLA